VKLDVGDLVVYGGHGAGRIIAREQRGSGKARQEVVVLELAASLTVTLPVALARETLRPLATERELANVLRPLRARPARDEAVWLKRQKASREKLAVGEPIGLAEVVSDGNRRHQAEVGRLSVSERALYLKARQLLAHEIGLVRGINAANADEWITDQLAHAGL
jgi:RNA polymerase-interacting CarD/CdnL/TRCF family regulator